MLRDFGAPWLSQKIARHSEMAKATLKGAKCNWTRGR